MHDYLPKCVFCDEEVDPRKAGTFYKTTGWVEYRGSAGGANSIELKEILGDYAHKICIEEKKISHKPLQDSLF